MAIIPFVSSYLQDTNESGQRPEFVGVTENPSGGSRNIPVVYGQRRVEGIRFWSFVSPTDSSILYCAYALSEDWCYGITQMFIDDKLLPLTSVDYAHRQPIVVNSGQFTSLVEIELVDGRNANPYYGTTPSNIGPSVLLQRDLNINVPWTNLCYVVCKFKYTVNGPFTQVPKVSVDLAGRRIAPYQSAQTGANYVTNPALIIWDLMSNPIYGRGIKKEAIDESSFTSVVNYCNTARPGISPSRAIFAINWICQTNSSPLANIKLILETFQLNLSFIQNKWVLTAEGSPAAGGISFGANNIIGEIQVQYPSVTSKLNRVLVEYIEPTNNFQTRTVEWPPTGTNTYLTEDNNLPLEKRISSNLVTSAIVATDIAKMTLLRSRSQTTYRFRATKEAHVCRIGDSVSIISSLPGIGVTAIVVSMTQNSDYTFEMECINYESAWYPQTYTNLVTMPVGETVAPPTIPTEVWTITTNRDTSNYIVYEGQGISYTIKTSGVPVSTAFDWKITGTCASADFATGSTALNGSGTINSSGEATISKTLQTSALNTRSGDRTIILTLYSTTGRKLQEHQLVLRDVTGGIQPISNYIYTFTSPTPKYLTKPDGTQNTDVYMGFLKSDLLSFDTARTANSGGTQLGAQLLVQAYNNGAPAGFSLGVSVELDLYIGFIDRLAVEADVVKDIYCVFEQFAQGSSTAYGNFSGYLRQSGLYSYGKDYWLYKPDGSTVTGDKYAAQLVAPSSRPSDVSTYRDIITGNDTSSFNSGAIKLQNYGRGLYTSPVPLHLHLSQSGNSPWPRASGYGGFFAYNDVQSNWNLYPDRLRVHFIRAQKGVNLHQHLGYNDINISPTNMASATIQSSREQWVVPNSGVFKTGSVPF